MTRLPLSQDVRIAQGIAERIKAAGIAEDDEDFTVLVEAECDLPERLIRMLRAARYEEAQADACADLIAKMRDRKVRRQNKADRIKAVVAWAMQEAGLRKLDAPDFTATMGKSRPGVTIMDEGAIPQSFLRVKSEPDKAAIRDALSRGEAVAGASLGNAEPYLTVRAS